MRRIYSFIIIFSLCFQSLWSEVNEYIPLKDLYADHFLVGNILAGGIDGNSLFRQDKEELALLIGEFNCLTAENSMKMQYVQPEEGVFNFKSSDALLHIADEAGMEVVGHALVWHHQVPHWIFKDSEGNPVSRKVLIQRMKDHIFEVVGRYKGKIKYWDVVNEALNDDGSLRKTVFLDMLGENYIEQAFSLANNLSDLNFNSSWFSLTYSPSEIFISSISSIKGDFIILSAPGF